MKKKTAQKSRTTVQCYSWKGLIRNVLKRLAVNLDRANAMILIKNWQFPLKGTIKRDFIRVNMKMKMVS